MWSTEQSGLVYAEKQTSGRCKCEDVEDEASGNITARVILAVIAYRLS